jgi:hypothetical protein
MNEVFWRFGELSAIQAESSILGPRAANKQGTRFFKHLYEHDFRKVEKLHCFVTNEVPFRFQEELMVRFEPQKRDPQ